jgi:hypothetical protein
MSYDEMEDGIARPRFEGSWCKITARKSIKESMPKVETSQGLQVHGAGR